MAASHTQSGRVVRISTNGENGDDVIHELYAVAIDDDQGALDFFHEQFAVHDSAHNRGTAAFGDANAAYARAGTGRTALKLSSAAAA
jgi:hypothetical protein